MIRRIIALIALLVPFSANAQFVNGQILTAQQLNTAFANVLPLTGGVLSGPLTVPAITVGTVNGVTLGTMASQNANAVAITGGTISGASITTPSPFNVANGGTGNGTLTAHNVLLGEGTSAVSFAAPAASGTILSSTGTTADPSFQSASALNLGVTTGTLAQFSATTSAQLAGVISDETGTGSLVFATGSAINPTSTGATTRGTGAFTTLSANSTVSGIGLIGVQAFTSSGTYTPDAGTQAVIIEVVGGGGGGGGCPATSSTQNCIAGSGQAGSYTKVYLTSGFTGGISVGVGAAGAAGTAGANSGSAGGTTTFGSVISCSGGAPGNGGSAFTSTVPGVAGTTGTSGVTCTVSSGTVLASVLGASYISQSLGAAGTAVSGNGGSSPIGAGGNWQASVASSHAGVSATGPGGAGSGAASTNSGAASAGGAGAIGGVIIYEFN
jgi:hypothetical protein